MKSVLTFFFLFTLTILSAQPKMTLWRVQDGHQSSGVHGDGHEAEQYECGDYYFFVSDGVAESTWSIKNEGSSNLELQLPLAFNANDATSMRINQQPATAILAPGEETLFKIEYDFYGVHGDFFLDINSNDPVNGSCGLLVGGNVLACTCYCVGGISQSIGFCSKGVGQAGGIPLFNEPCDPPTSNEALVEGESCQPISIADPCSCENTITTAGGQLLFRDTLSVMTLPNVVLVLTENNGGFLDDKGNEIADGTSLSQADSDGLVTEVFYRLPGESVDIVINGVSFFNGTTCPDASTCNPVAAESIPTMGEWGLISLGLLFLIFSIVAIKVEERDLQASR